MNEPIFSIKGTGGKFDLFDNYLLISKKDLNVFPPKINDRKIYIKDIKSINYQKPTILKNGYIQILFSDQLKKDLTSKEALLDPNSLLIKGLKKQTIIDSENFYKEITKKIENKSMLSSTANDESEIFNFDKIMNLTIDRNNDFISRKKNILSSKIESSKLTSIKDYEVDQQIDSKEKHHRLTRAIVGSALLGGAGAVVGGLTGGKTVKYINNLSVNIIFYDDTVWNIKFITSKTKVDSILCKETLGKFDNLCKILSTVIDNNHEEN